MSDFFNHTAKEAIKCELGVDYNAFPIKVHLLVLVCFREVIDFAAT